MKKYIKTIAIILVLAAVIVACLSACERKEEEKDEGIVITFVTGFENDDPPIIIEPRTSTLAKPAEMPEDPMKTGYKFLGWFYDADGTRPFSTKDGLKTDTTLYAKWEKKRADAGETNNPTVVESPEGLRYRLKEDGAFTLVTYVGTASEISVPRSYEGKKVTSIEERAFSNSTLTKITLPDTIAEIEDGAFYGCTSLLSIEVSPSNEVFNSEDGVLYAAGKTELVAVGQGRTGEFTVSNQVAKIRGYAFGGGVYKVIFKENSRFSVVGNYAFANFNGKVTLGGNITAIRRRAFYGATAEITFGADFAVDRLEMGEFDGYKGEKLTLPSSIKSISGSPFYGMTAEIDFTATGIKALGESAFAGYAGETLELPYFVESTGRNCFYRCSSKITFDERTTYAAVGEYAFHEFWGEVTFPDTVKTVGEYAFYAVRYGKIAFTVPKGALSIADNAFSLCNVENVSFA